MMKTLFRLVMTLSVGVLTMTSSARVAAAQRTLTADEMERAAQRRIALEQAKRDAAARTARTQAEDSERLKRLNVMGEAIPGLPFIKARTVVVTRTRVVFMYMEPDVTVSLPKPERLGYYVWRWNMSEGASPFSLVFTADTAMRSADIGDIVKSARIRRCNSTFETQALACKNPVEAFVTRQGQGFRIEVADSAIMKSMMTARPRTMTLVTFAPLGRSISTTYNVLYSDPNVKADRSK